MVKGKLIYCHFEVTICEDSLNKYLSLYHYVNKGEKFVKLIPSRKFASIVGSLESLSCIIILSPSLKQLTPLSKVLSQTNQSTSPPLCGKAV